MHSLAKSAESSPPLPGTVVVKHKIIGSTQLPTKLLSNPSSMLNNQSKLCNENCPADAKEKEKMEVKDITGDGAELLSNLSSHADAADSTKTSQRGRSESEEQTVGKRQRDDNDDPSPEDLSRMSRSERKRHREKKRRSDVNKGFDDLMALLIEIDPAVKAEVDEKARKTQGRPAKGNDLDSSVLINRVDLISRAVASFERVHKENEERKLLIADLSSRLGGDMPASASALTGNKVASDKVTMMIPMLTPSDPAISVAARNAEVMAQQQMFQNSLAQARFQQAIPVNFPNFPPGNFLGFGSPALRGSTQSSMPPTVAASLLRPNSGSDSFKRQHDLMRQFQQSGSR